MRTPAHASRRSRVLLSTAACLLAVVGLASPAVAAPPPEDQAISAEENAARQIGALQQLKKSQNKTEAKVDSRLVVEQRRAGQPLRDGRAAPSEQRRSGLLRKGPGGRARHGHRRPAQGSDATRAPSLKSVSTRYGTVRAELPLTAVNTVAARADVTKVEAAGGAMTARQLDPNAKQAPPESKEDKDARIAENTRRALADRAGPIDSAGDRTHNADTARAEIGVTGVGVKICALSDGIDSLAASQAGGELPAVDVLPTQAGGGDEGTAMLEIIHDVAPNAELGFATAFNGDASFADNIRGAAVRAELRRDRRRHHLLQGSAVPGLDHRAGRERRDRRRRAVLLLGRQRGQHGRRHGRALGGRLRQLRPGDRQVRGLRPRLRPGPGHPDLPAGVHRRPRPARPCC